MQYGVADRIEFILCDFVTFASSLSSSSTGSKPLNGIDTIFLSPPWGGIEYLSFGAGGNADGRAGENAAEGTPAKPISYPLSAVQPLHGKELFELARSITDDIVSGRARRSEAFSACSPRRSLASSLIPSSVVCFRPTICLETRISTKWRR